MHEFLQTSQPFLLPGPAGQLEVMTTWPKANVKAVVGIICHPHPLFDGTMHNKVVTMIAKAFDELGIKTVRFNFRGVGASTGKYGETIGESDDLLAILNWVKRVLPDHAIWLAGFSFGGYIAANIAAQENVPQLVTIAPGISHHQFERLNAITCPWLIVQGDADDITPLAVVSQFIETHPALNITFRVIPGASHFFDRRLIELKAVLIDELSHHFSAP